MSIGHIDLKIFTSNKHYPNFAKGDWDGFFGLFIDNLMQLMLIMILCRSVCGFTTSFITSRLLPGAAVAIFGGNIFYAWQARRLARETGRRTVTALPFGINTVSLLAFIFLVMGPVYAETGDAEQAWRVGLAACFISGLIEIMGAFVGDWVKRQTPRAALLSGLAGVGLSFMTVGFSFQIFSSPSIALIPAFFVLAVYAGRVKLPLRLPGGLVAVVIGVVVAWILKSMGLASLSLLQDPIHLSFNWPRPAIVDLFFILFHPAGWAAISVVIPMGLFNVISSIQNLESAEAAGDSYKTKPSLLANGLTTLLACSLGCPFPTSIYLGHPGWKAMGARSGYSVLNGTAILIMVLAGGLSVILKVVPLEVTLGILLWIGLVIVGQAFVDSDRRHAVAVVVGLVPSVAAWVLNIIETTLRSAGTNLFETFHQFSQEFYIKGVLSLYQGFLITAVVLSSIIASAVDRQFKRAALWSFFAAAASFVGLIHAYHLTPSGIQNSFGLMAAPSFVFAYTGLGIVLFLLTYTKVQED